MDTDSLAAMIDSVGERRRENKAREHLKWFQQLSEQGRGSAATEHVISGLERMANSAPDPIPMTSTGMLRRSKSLQDLRMSHNAFWESRQYLEKDYLPRVWLRMHAYLSDSKNILDGNERYKDCTWLREFRTSNQTSRIFSFQPVNFTMSLLRFKEDPDELITILKQYNIDIRTRDLTEEMIKYALRGEAPIEDAFYFLLDKFVEAIDGPTAPDEASAHASDRISGLRQAYQKLSNAPDAEIPDNEPHTSRTKVRDFLHDSIEKDDGAEDSLFLCNLLTIASKVKRSWHVESYRAVVNVLATMNDEHCPQELAITLLDQLQKLNREPHISMSHRHFNLATLAFVEIVCGEHPKDFYHAIQKLRDIAKHRNEQYKHFFDEIKTLRAEIEKHRKVIVCLEYRHILEHLSRVGEDYIVKQKRRTRPDLKTATEMWQSAWELAVETELLKMCREKFPPKSTIASSASAPPGNVTSSTTAAHPSSSQSAPATLPPTGAPAASTTAATPPLSPPILRSLLQKDFNVWSCKNQTMCSNIGQGGPSNQPAQAAQAAQVSQKKQAKKSKQKNPANQGGQTSQASQATASFSDIPYRQWGSYAHGVTLYGDLSNEIHGYGRTYDIAGELLLQTDMKVLEWLKPRLLKSEDDKTVDWTAEWKERQLPV